MLQKMRNNMTKCHQNENNDIIPDECYYPYIPSGKYCLKKCITGYSTECQSCSQIPGKIDKCGKCYPGYYIPTDSNKTFCLHCGSGCRYCNGTQRNKTCQECYNNYVLYENKCIQNCNLYYDYYDDYNNEYYKTYCKTCNPEPGKNDRCLTCNEGYYLPTFSTDYNENRYCRKCPNNCKKCYGDYYNPLCTECNDKYHLKNNECFKTCSYLISETNCSEYFCFESEEYITYSQCSKCNPGYYLPNTRKIDEYYNQCYKCSMPGCIRCEGDNNETNICLECDNNTNPIIINGTIISCYQTCDIGEGGKCKSCRKESSLCGECNEEYMLYNNRCVLEYHIYAKYRTTYKNEYVKLINYNEIEKLKINETIIKNPNNYFYFSNPW